MDREGTAHQITAPLKLKTLFTMLAANAMKEMPKTTDKSSLKPPLMSSLFIMKMTPHSAIATMEIHLPAGPVMVFTTCSRGEENSVMPPDAAANSGKTRRQRAARAKKVRRDFLLSGVERTITLMTVSMMEAVMRRLAGARGPQNDASFTTRAQKLYFSGFHASFGQQFVAVAATHVFRVFGCCGHGNCPSWFASYKFSVS